MGSSYNVLITELAKNDIDEILEYISINLSNPEAAKKLWNNLKDGVKRISMFPYAMPTYKGKFINNEKEYRRLNINNFAIIYKIIEDIKEIRIMTAFYTPSLVSQMFRDI
ncbi:MAG: type II toxin-antitoxin system RelE/ParE family toxin, partial [Bacilli bacterium]|nr:type II toxin-antitoxin system RelE/ParE family toxin [Bacilli bacterium]